MRPKFTFRPLVELQLNLFMGEHNQQHENFCGSDFQLCRNKIPVITKIPGHPTGYNRSPYHLTCRSLTGLLVHNHSHTIPISLNGITMCLSPLTESGPHVTVTASFNLHRPIKSHLFIISVSAPTPSLSLLPSDFYSSESGALKRNWALCLCRPMLITHTHIYIHTHTH